MKKYLELFKESFNDSINEKTKPENKPYVGYSLTEDKVVYTVVPKETPINYFYIESLEDNNVITLDSTTWAGYSDNKSKLEYSNDTTSWTSMNGVDSITINNGEHLYMRCIDSNICKDMYSIPEEDVEIILLTPLFKSSTNCNIGGNINSVMFDYTYKTEDCVLSAGAFVGLFTGIDMMTGVPANYIIDASKLVLPAMELTYVCYSYMFYGCTSLTTAPELLATTLAENCYTSMFQNCTSLTTAPELPATELAKSCYHYMFSSCSSLTTAPELPAAILTEGCYSGMFHGCININLIKCLATDRSAAECTYDWVNGVSSTGVFVKHPDMNDWSITYDGNGVPIGWIIEDAEL